VLSTLTDGNSLEIDKICHLLVVSDTTVFAFIDTHTASTQCNCMDYNSNWLFKCTRLNCAMQSGITLSDNVPVCSQKQNDQSRYQKSQFHTLIHLNYNIVTISNFLSNTLV